MGGVIIFIVLLFVTNLSYAVETALGFGKLTPDKDIISLLKECNSKIRALWYASPYGGGGSASRQEWYEPERFFIMMRKNILEIYRDMYLANLVTFKIILDNNLLSKEELERYPKLLKYIKSLVNGYYQYSKGFDHIKNGGPVVYAVLVDTDNVSCLEDSGLVKEVSVNHFPLFSVFLKYVPYYFRPEQYGKYYFFPEIKNADAEELYMMIKKAVKETINNQEFAEYYKKLYIETGFYNQRLEFLRHMIEKSKRKSSPSPTYFPSDGTILYTGTNVVRYDEITWDLPGDWSVNKPGYEHDLVARRDYFTGCVSSTSLPEGYDDCPTACVSELTGDYCAFSFGTYNALLIEPGFLYQGEVQLIRGPSSYTDFRLNAQEVFHSPVCFKFFNRWICIPCPFDTPWCMGGTPYREGNPDLLCPKNSLILKKCEFRRFFPYSSSWTDKYDCTDAIWCD